MKQENYQLKVRLPGVIMYTLLYAQTYCYDYDFVFIFIFTHIANNKYIYCFI